MSGVEPEVHLRISYICGESLFSLFKRSKLFICRWRAGEVNYSSVVGGQVKDLSSGPHMLIGLTTRPSSYLHTPFYP